MDALVSTRNHGDGWRIRGLAIRAVVYLGSERIGTRLVDQLVTIVLVRLLVPNDFGTVALASVLTGLVNMSTCMLGFALIQRKTIDETHLSTAFWAHIATGLVMFGIVAASSPFIARFAHNPSAGIVATALAGQFILGAGSAVQIALLTRRMNFRAISLRSLLATFIGGVVAIILAYRGAGAWALVGQVVTTTAASAAVLYTATGWRPKLIFSWARFQELFSFGVPMLGSRIIGFTVRNIDNLLIGRYLGMQALGFYVLAYTIFLTPLADLGLVNQALFAGLSRVQDDPHRLKRGFLDATEFVTMVVLPMMVGLSLVAPLFVRVLFGDKWLPSAPVISVLAIAGCFRLLVTLGPSALQAAGRPGLHLQWAVLSAFLYLPAFYVGVSWGIVGVAMGYLAVSIVLVPIHFAFVARVMKIGMTDVFRTVGPAVVASTAMAAAVFGGRTLLAATSLPTVVVLVDLIGLGILTYGATVWLVAPGTIRRLLHLVHGGLPTRRARQVRVQDTMPQVDPTDA